MKTSRAVLLLILAACGREECDFVPGAYRIAWAEGIGGTCGPIDPIVVTLNRLGTAPLPDCVQTVSIDNCGRFAAAVDCPTASGGASVQDIDIRVDARGLIGGEQTVTIYNADGIATCMSDYIVTIDKL